ncbi:hypothetical protein K504DRAFT_390113 [Pleomassaria siparia CBS 279.74]|uniref:Peptidase S28 n=1 Tax=Pleomassaria siparia CBS 279.74 TaxID=1314801 RepID=A0A6G1JVM5_9PLEO|nr:hypothetical protein K504DRAFT_390113 [Pleomassaria siparia CBS 279.74]
MRVVGLIAIFCGIAAASPASPGLQALRNGEPEKRQAATAAYAAHTIDMPIDHFLSNPRYKPHANGTFKQRYFFDSSYYKPGGPVFLYIGGETSGESRFSNLQTGIIQILMEATNGLGVILENRYYGESYPFNTSTTDDLRYLTTEQTIADNEYFAKHAVFEGVSGNLSAPGTPWILYGGSLAGAQTAFTMKEYNSLFAGGIGSSATAQALLAYPYWYDPIIKYGPSDCVSRIINIVDKIDEVIASNNTKAIQQLKEVFGLGELKSLGDFAMTIAFPIGGPMNYPTNTWQELNWNYPHAGSEDFYDFCGNVTNPNPPEVINDVDYALANYTHGEAWTGLGGYADYVKKTLIPQCESGRIDSTDVGCFGTQNQTFYADPTNGGARSYLYSTCTEQGAYQVAKKHNSLISRALQIPYTQQWCTWAFPPGKYNSIPPTPDLDSYNKYGGYNIQAPRLALIDGEADVWVDLCYHSNLAPSPRYSSDLHPSYLIAGGGHHWDSTGIKNVTAEPGYIKEAHLWEIRTVRRWVASWGK